MQMTKFKSFKALDQGFPTCGTRTTGGTQTGARWYAERFQNKNLTIFCLFKEKIHESYNFLSLTKEIDDPIAGSGQ